LIDEWKKIGWPLLFGQKFIKEMVWVGTRNNRIGNLVASVPGLLNAGFHSFPISFIASSITRATSSSVQIFLSSLVILAETVVWKLIKKSQA
jgi:hypothetical protein